MTCLLLTLVSRKTFRITVRIAFYGKLSLIIASSQHNFRGVFACPFVLFKPFFLHFIFFYFLLPCFYFLRVSETSYLRFCSMFLHVYLDNFFNSYYIFIFLFRKFVSATKRAMWFPHEVLPKGMNCQGSIFVCLILGNSMLIRVL